MPKNLPMPMLSNRSLNGMATNCFSSTASQNTGNEKKTNAVNVVA